MGFKLLKITRLEQRDVERWQSFDMESLPRSINEGEVLWVDAEAPSDDEFTSIKKYFGLDEETAQEMVVKPQRSKIEQNGNRMFCLLNFPRKEGFDVFNIKMDRFAVFISKSWIVTYHKEHSDIIDTIHKKIKERGYTSLSQFPTTDVILYILLDLITDDYYPVSDLIYENLETVRREVAALFRSRTNRSESRNYGLKLGELRDQLLNLRQSINPLREIMGKIVRGEFSLIGSTSMPRFNDLYDRTIQLIETMDTHREHINDIRELYMNVQTVTTNNIIRILTIISAIFLPLNLIAAIYGTNFSPGFFEPGSGYPYSFYIMVMTMIVIALSLMYIFRRRGWI